MKYRKSLFFLLFALIAILFMTIFTACDNGESMGNQYEYRIDRKSYIFREGETIKLNIMTKDEDYAVVWSSSQPSIVAIDNNGLATALSAGRATITAQIDNLKLTCEMSVKERLVELFLDSDNFELAIIEDDYERAKQLSCSVKVNYALTETDIFWTTENNEIATVDNGFVSAVGKGETKITASIIIMV